MSKKGKQNKLATKLTTYVVIGIVISFAALTTIIAFTTKAMIHKLQRQELLILAEGNAKTASEFMQSSVSKQSVLSSSIKIIEEGPPEDRVDNLKTLIKETKKGEPDIVSLFYISSKDPSAPNGFTVYATNSTIDSAENQTVFLKEQHYASVETAKNFAIIDPYKKTIDGKEYLVISVLQPIFDNNNNILGIIGSDIDTVLLNSAAYNTGGYESFANAIICGHQTFIINSANPDTIGKKFTESTSSTNPNLILDVGKNVQPKFFSDVSTNGTKYYRACVPFYVGTSKTVWINVTSVLKSELDIPARRQVLIVLVTSILSLIVLALLTFYIIQRSLLPIKEVQNAAGEISKGNFNVNLRVSSNDEIGNLVEAFITLRDTILLLIKQIYNVSDSLRAGDIDARINPDEFHGEYNEAVTAINGIIGDYIEEITTILNAYGEFGNGNFNVTLKQYPGKKALANEMFDTLNNNLKSVSSDISRLINHAIDGKLEARVDTNMYKGDWKKLTDGLNNLLQAVNTPIHEANCILSELSKGNFDISVSESYKGSFDVMANSLREMIASIGSYINEITEILGNMAQGDLSKEISRDYVGQFGLIKNSINNISQTLRNTIAEIKTSSQYVLDGARKISEYSMDLANGASSQAGSIEELNANILTINEQTRKTAQESKTANELSMKSSQGAKNGNNEMIKMLHSMDDIKEASNSISKIIKVIDDIAFQTNILALNAAVEAARAGEHGKGFAVVAEEVRSLAGRSQQAAQDTTALIEDTINKISEGTATAKTTADSLSKIVSDTNLVSEKINTIYLAATEQSDGISQISHGINEISEVVQRNSSVSEEAASSAQELNSQSEILSQMVSKFKV